MGVGNWDFHSQVSIQSHFYHISLCSVLAQCSPSFLQVTLSWRKMSSRMGSPSLSVVTPAKLRLAPSTGLAVWSFQFYTQFITDFHLLCLNSWFHGASCCTSNVLEAEFYPVLMCQIWWIGFPEQLSRKLFLWKQTKLYFVLLPSLSPPPLHLLPCLQLFFFLRWLFCWWGIFNPTIVP